MKESQSLRVLIIEKAGELFREQGYAATTIKQIAKAAGCTTAALYYYFEDGKQHILREVIHRSARRGEVSSQLSQAGSLEEFVVELGNSLADRFPKDADRFNWIMLQFPTLPEEEKRIVQNQVIGRQRELQAQIGRFVADDRTAERLAWLIFCSYLGHQQIFTKMEVGQRVDLSLDEYGRFLAQIVGLNSGPGRLQA